MGGLSDRVLLAPKKRELFKFGATAGISGFVASYTIDANGEDIQPPVTAPYLEALPVARVKEPADMVDPPPQQYAHPDEAGREPHQGWDHWPFQKVYVIEVKEGMHSFHPKLPTQKIWGYDGTVPGSTIVAYEGEPVVVRYVNLLPADATSFGSPEISTHLHNGHAASESDGFAGNYFSPTIAGPTLDGPGKFYDCLYTNCYAGYDQFPESDGDSREGLGTLWYHDHREGFTAANVYKGLAGFYLLFDKLDSGDENDLSDEALRLPSGVGDYDIPLMICNPKFDQKGVLIFDQFDTDGFLGNKITVNGKISPYFHVARRKYRFRFLNASVARFYHLSVRHNGVNLPFQVIANDGNLLPAAVPMTSFGLAPAERIDIVVDFSATPIKINDELFLVDRILQDKGRGPEAFLSAVATRLMRFNVTRDAPDNSRVPDRLRELPPIDLKSVTKRRYFKFERENGVWEINGKIFDMENPTFMVKRGATEIWTLEGNGSWHHPIHVHLEEFRILSRNGKPPPPHEAGRKDVVVLKPGEIVRIFIRFRDFTGKYMMHCHNTIHEDHAMMLRFDVEDEN